MPDPDFPERPGLSEVLQDFSNLTPEQKQSALESIYEQDPERFLEAAAKVIEPEAATTALKSARAALRAYAKVHPEAVWLQLYADEVEDILRRFVATTTEAV